MSNTDNRPIGFFDSGVGGLAVVRAVMDVLPQERVVYLGDTARGPYGPRSQAQVRQFAIEDVRWLQQHDVKLVVAACNTATAAALQTDPVRFDLPVLGVINPAVEAAVAATRNGTIGVIGTEGTVMSGAYDRAIERFLAGRSGGSDGAGSGGAEDITVVSQACPTFVALAEQGRTSDHEVLQTARRYLAPLQEAKVDTLILGCTHYPLLTGVIGYVMGPDVTLISSAETCARVVFRYLVENGALAGDGALAGEGTLVGNGALAGDRAFTEGGALASGKLSVERTTAPAPSRPEHLFAATGNPHQFAELAERFLGPRIQQADVHRADTARG